MLGKKEIFSILGIALAIGTAVSFSAETIGIWQKTVIPTIITVLIVILINVASKKIIAYHFGDTIEIKTWEFSRFLFVTKEKLWGHKPHQRLRSPFPAGFFMPLIVKFLSVGLLNWMACLTFDVKGTIYRAAKKWQSFQFTEVTEAEMAWIAFAGILGNLTFGILGYLINAPLFSRINFTYAFFQVLPIGNLDGTKMFFGQKTLFWISTVLVSIGVVVSITIV